MPHALTELKLTEVTRPAGKGSGPVHEIRADVCVVGAGIAGLSAAIESARLLRDVVLVDSLPLIGGQMVHSLIGLFCEVFGNRTWPASPSPTPRSSARRIGPWDTGRRSC